VRFGIKAKQVAGVTALVGFVVILLSAWDLSELARVHLQQTQSQAKLIQDLIYQRAFSVIRSGVDPQTGLRSDDGLQSVMLSGRAFSKNVQYAEIVDTNNVTIATSDETQLGQVRPPVESLTSLLSQGWLPQIRAIYSPGGRTYELNEKLFLESSGGGRTEFGAIRVGVSTFFIRAQLEQSLQTPLYTSLILLLGASLAAMLLAQVVLRPIHVIRSGLARLGRGELDVKVDLPPEDELDGLRDSFKAVSARLASDRTQLEGQRATLESVVEHLEDAVALFAPDGKLLFANPAMRAALDLKGSQSSLADVLPAAHPYRSVVEDTLKKRQSYGPQHVRVPGAGERLVLTHIVEDADDRWLGVVLVARNLAYLSEVESTITYSRKLAALGRLSAGIAHEVKNPLNATMIHLELLKMQVKGIPSAQEHLQVIAAQVRRLDEVVQGFLKFTRPENLHLEPLLIPTLFQDLMPIITPEAEKSGIAISTDFPADVPAVSADAGMLQQAFLNLALNACQAMPNGGHLRISTATRPGRRVEVTIEDTGVGIPPEHLNKIFDLYFTTKEHGTGIGLSMVYRTVQLHDGDIEVQSVPGRGTTFRILLRQA
jgi:signal transduction histidine kinase